MHGFLFAMLATAGFLAPPQVTPPGALPRATIPRLEQRATIDGVLDDEAWASASVLTDFWQYEPVDGRRAEERTEVRVWYAPDAIYFGIHAFDRDPSAIRATKADRDNIDSEDHVIVYLDTFDDKRRAFFFAVNALGVQQDGVRTEGASTPGRMFGGNTDKNPDFIFDSKGRLTDDGYVVEVRIPFRSLRYPSANRQTWGLNIERHTQRTGFTDTWTPVRRANASFLAQAGSIDGLENLRGGIALEAQPFITATAAGERLAASGSFERQSIDADAGVNLRAGITSVSLDATINPDFSQVETDSGQVTLNERFALFFPEKRPFFLEGIELFATPNQLIYTRQIADPIAGGKITGKLGQIGFAHLTALDESDPAADALFNVTRLRRDMGASSVAGLTFTDRSVLDSDDANRVLAGDVRVVFGKLYYFEGQLGGSWTRDAIGSRNAPIWKATLDRTGRRWGFNYSINGIDDDFVARAGFVPRNGIVDAHGFNRVSFYGAQGALIETFTAFGGVSRLWRYADFGSGVAIEGSETANMMLRMRGGWQLSTDLGRNFVQFDPAGYAGLTSVVNGAETPYAPLDDVSGGSITFRVTTPRFQGGEGSASLGFARTPIFPEGAEGNRTSATAGVLLRPTSSIRVISSGTFQRINRARDGSEFARTIIPRLKAELQPRRSLFFRLVGEYRAERRSALVDARTGSPILNAGVPVAATDLNTLRLDALISFEPTPGTVFFLGYGSTLDGPSAFEFSDLERTRDGFFLKLAYRFRR